MIDDDSSDGHGGAGRRGVHPRATDAAHPLKGAPPPGFVGKSWACAQLAAAADPKATVLVFLDANVVLAPEALTRTVTLLRDAGLDFVSPYPRQRALSPSERLIQPLLQWSWLTFAPLRLAERSPRRSLAMANGQFLAVDSVRYPAEAGGHAATGVRDAVIEDLGLARALRSHRRHRRDGRRDAPRDLPDVRRLEEFATATPSRCGPPVGANLPTASASWRSSAGCTLRRIPVTYAGGRCFADHRRPPDRLHGCCPARSPTRCPSPPSSR